MKRFSWPGVIGIFSVLLLGFAAASARADEGTGPQHTSNHAGYDVFKEWFDLWALGGVRLRNGADTGHGVGVGGTLDLGLRTPAIPIIQDWRLSKNPVAGVLGVGGEFHYRSDWEKDHGYNDVHIGDLDLVGVMTSNLNYYGIGSIAYKDRFDHSLNVHESGANVALGRVQMRFMQSDRPDRGLCLNARVGSYTTGASTVGQNSSDTGLIHPADIEACGWMKLGRVGTIADKVSAQVGLLIGKDPSDNSKNIISPEVRVSNRFEFRDFAGKVPLMIGAEVGVANADGKTDTTVTLVSGLSL